MLLIVCPARSSQVRLKAEPNSMRLTRRACGLTESRVDRQGLECLAQVEALAGRGPIGSRDEM